MVTMNSRTPIWAALLMSAPFYTQASVFCFEEAGALYGVSPQLLKAVAWVESSMRPDAVNKSHASKTQSRDIGLMQINSRWLQREPFRSLGYREEHLRDTCTNIKVGAWVLAGEFRRYGTTWEAVGAYNAACTQLKGESCTRTRNTYAWKVYRAMSKTS